MTAESGAVVVCSDGWYWYKYMYDVCIYIYMSVLLSRWTNLSPQRCRVKLAWSATMATAVCGWGPWLSTTCGTLTAT